MPTRRSSLSLLAAICLMFLAASSTVSANEGPSDEDIERAEEAFSAGASFYFEGEYGRAIVEFRRAAEIYPHPIFYHNIALSHRQLGRADRTLSYAEDAREAAAKLSDLDRETWPARADAANSAMIASFQGVVKAQELARAVAPDEEQDGDQPVAGVTEIETPPQESSFGALGWAGVAGVTLGVGALAGAAVMDRSILSGVEEVEQGTFDGTRQDRISELESQQTTGKILLGAGAGLTVVGATLVVLELMGGSSDQAMAIGPSLSRPGIDVRFQW